MHLKSVFQLGDLRNKRVLLRVDFNVLDSKGRIESDFRLKAVVPTIQYLVSRKAKVILASHAGRPGGKVVPSLSLKPVARRMQVLLKRKVGFCPVAIGIKADKAVAGLKPGEILLLENLRFYKGEDNNSDDFAFDLSRLADVFVNDAFGVSHRENASVVAITKFLHGYAGLLLEKEIAALTKVRNSPRRPMVAIIGGAKVSDKLAVINNLINKVDTILVGGAASSTFFKSLGHNVAKSLYEPKLLDMARQLYKKYSDKIVLPLTVEVARVTSKGPDLKSVREITLGEIKASEAILDVGSKCLDQYWPYIAHAGTIFWAGTMGDTNYAKFSVGTLTTAAFLGKSKAYTMIGGGETVSAIEKLKLAHKISHISTGGGASLEFLAGKELPGVKALIRRF